MFKLVDYDESGSDEEKGEFHDDQNDTFDCGINLPRVDVTEAKRFPQEPVASSKPVSLHAPLDTSQEQANKVHTISNEMASKLIYEKDLAGFGISDIELLALSMTSWTLASQSNKSLKTLILIHFLKALDPNIHQTLLKNLNTKVMAQVATGLLPQIKKDSKDKMAKRKHQITHLAALAVSREEELQDKWAESRARKKASSQKYGF